MNKNELMAEIKRRIAHIKNLKGRDDCEVHFNVGAEFALNDLYIHVYHNWTKVSK